MYLSIDLGDKKCGVAVYLEGVIIPKGVVPRIKIINLLKKYINDYNIWVIVVGLPYDLYGKKIKQLEKTKKFVKKLKDIFPDISVDTIDERYTSFEAKNLKSGNDKFDDISALIILESYLKKIGFNY